MAQATTAEQNDSPSMGRALSAGVGEMAVPIAVVAIVLALIMPMPGAAAGFPDRHRHHAVGDRHDGGGVHPHARSISAYFPPRCCCSRCSGWH